LPQVIQLKLEALGLRPEQDFVFALRERYPVREIVVQHAETDWAFVSRLCEHLGITTFFRQEAEREVFILTDVRETFERAAGRGATLPVRLRREHPAAYDVETTLARVPRVGHAHDYNYRAPRLVLHDALEHRHPVAQGEWIDCPHARA
jgi:type VI secretion system secreted protein VgrG